MAAPQPGVTTETELACIERDAQAGLADLRLSLAEAKQLTAALEAEIVPMQMAALGECPRACLAWERRLASKGYSQVRFRSLFGDVPVRVRRFLSCPCQAGAAVAPELAYVTVQYAAFAPFGKVAALLYEYATAVGSGTDRRDCRRIGGRNVLNR